jgi:Na+/H+ antiporter NhaD/arsenite permease-like protein
MLRRVTVQTASLPHGALPGTTAISVIFALTYCGIAVGHVPGLRLNRTGIALLGAIAIMIFSGLPTQTVVGFVDWPTVLLLFGFFVLSAQLRLSGFFDAAAAGLAARLDNPARFLLTLMAVVAGLSAFLNHDIVCFAFAPVVGAALVRKHLNPVPFLVALAIASNIGAAATIVGNPQDMMIAQAAKLSFGPYLLWCITPVLLALAAAYGIIWGLSRNSLASDAEAPARPPAQLRPFNRFHTIKGLVILALVVALFFTSIPKEIVALTAAGIHLASPKYKTEDLLAEVDWPILVLFIALFVVTGAFQSTGYGDRAVEWLARGGLDLESPRVLAVATAALSNVINNSAAALLLVKVVNVSRPPAAYVLALANSFGGSLIVIGSVSNIIVMQQAREIGITISFRSFARLGVPVTLAAITILLGWITVMK